MPKKKAEQKAPLKKPAKTVPKKKQKKQVIPKEPQITEAQFEKWFFDMKPQYFLRMQTEWNERNLKIKLQNQKDYDSWLNYFKGLPPNTIKLLATTGLDILTTEAYAALRRWYDIIGNPHRIDKIHQSGLTDNSREKEKGIVQMALENDRLGVLKATRASLAEKIEKGASARDIASLAREITDVMTQIASYEKKLGPKKSTVLGELLGEMPQAAKRNRNAGTRRTSFAAKVTIDDTEATNG